MSPTIAISLSCVFAADFFCLSWLACACALSHASFGYIYPGRARVGLCVCGPWCTSDCSLCSTAFVEISTLTRRASPFVTLGRVGVWASTLAFQLFNGRLFRLGVRGIRGGCIRHTAFEVLFNFGSIWLGVERACLAQGDCVAVIYRLLLSISRVCCRAFVWRRARVFDIVGPHRFFMSRGGWTRQLWTRLP